MKIFLISAALLFTTALHGAGNSKKPIALSLDEVIKIAIEKNLDIKNLRKNYAKSSLKKDLYLSSFSPLLGAGSSYYKLNQKLQGMALVQGTQLEQSDLYTFLRKKFTSGTFLETRLGYQYFKNNATGNFAINGQHNTAVEVTLKQSLWKNFLGINDRREISALDLEWKGTTEYLKEEYSRLISTAVINYLYLSILQERVHASAGEFENASYVLGILNRNRRIGAAELADVLQWQTIVSQKKIQLKRDRKDFDAGLINFLNFLRMPLDNSIELKTPLKRNLPALDDQRSIEQALHNRNDYKSARILLKSALVRRKLEENNTRPDLNLILKLTPKGQDESLATASQDMGQAKFYQSYIGIEFTYPLGDDPARIKYQSTILEQQILANNVAKIRESIIAEVKNSINEIKNAHDNYQIAAGNHKIADQFYTTVLSEYRKGRYNVFKIKEALDSQTIANNLVIQTLVQFNIALVKHQVALNTLFSDYNIRTGTIMTDTKEK